MTDTRRVEVRTGARLHFGLLSVNSDRDRQFGGAGMMIDHPGCHLELRAADSDHITGDGAERGRDTLRRFRRMCPADQQPPPCQITIHENIPSHGGFGSGTQFELALTQGLWLMRPGLDAAASTVTVDQLADWGQRGRRSAIGIHGFRQGGFLVDGGKSQTAAPAPLIARMEVPSDWRIVLVRPQQVSGLSGASEQRAFDAFPPMPTSTTDRLCRLLLMQILPALAEANLTTFGTALAEYGRTVGHYFSQSDKQWIEHPAMQQLVEWVQNRGKSAGQSSWGPTIWILCEQTQDAQQLLLDLEADGRWSGCWTAIAAPRNHGADLECAVADSNCDSDVAP